VAEELYDYGNSNCASHDNAYLIEQKNIADQPEQKAQLEQLSGRLEEMLIKRVKSMKQSSIPPASTAPLEVPQPKKKRKKS
jgi:hypothetical protein